MKQTIAKHTKTTTGFTIVEITLSMAFISALLVTIAIITVNIISIYQKGLAIRSVNSVGRNLIDDFTHAIKTAPTKAAVNLCNDYYEEGTNGHNKCKEDKGQLFVFQENRSSTSANISADNAITDETTVAAPPTHGAFCTGHYTYVWNTGYVLAPSYGLSSEAAKLRYKLPNSNTTKDISFRLLRLMDPERLICRNNVAANYTLKDTNLYDATAYEYNTDSSSYFIDLLSSVEGNLALYDMQVFPPVEHAHTSHIFFSGTFILGTVNGSVNIKATGNYCNSAPDNLSTDFAYCAINKFNFAARATGELNDVEQIERR